MSDQNETPEAESMEAPAKPQCLAKKDFVICQNEYFREIKAGDDLSDVPEKFSQNLKTEGVL